MENDINLHWYPGHMTKARRMMEEQIKLVDLIVEILDARIPISSRNPMLEELGKGKDRLIILNKKDLVLLEEIEKFEEYYKSLGYVVASLESKKKSGLNALSAKIEEAAVKKRERDKKRGILNRPIRAMIVGIPNVGKSTIINMLAGRNVASTGNKPGVTRGQQWIRLNKNVELLDTPGVLWPKFEDKKVGINLALTGAIKEDIIPTLDLAAYGIDHFFDIFNREINSALDVSEKYNSPYDYLNIIGQKRGMLKKGGEIDINQAALSFLEEFRNGKLGRCILDKID